MTRKRLLLIAVLVLSATALASHNGTTWEQIHDTYTRVIVIRPNAATLGPTAPSATTVGTYRGLGFGTANDELFVEAYIPDDWDGESDLTISLCWCPEDGDPLQDGETVKWSGTYRLTAEGESLENGTAVTCADSYTQSGASAATERICCDATIDWDHADQPVEAGDLLGWIISRDTATDTYSGYAVVMLIRIEYQADKLGR